MRKYIAKNVGEETYSSVALAQINFFFAVFILMQGFYHTSASGNPT